MAEKQAPSTAPVSLRDKAAYNARLARSLVRGLTTEPTFRELADLDEYDRLIRRHGSGTLDDARVVEIGFGARPLRLLALHARGVDATGVDVEAPLLRGTPGEFVRIFRENGAERAAKSFARYLLRDVRERRALARELRRRGQTLEVRPDRYIVADATALELPAGSADAIVSEDVFEHIPADRLPALVDRMAEWLAPGGVALIRPMVFTGILGGHDAFTLGEAEEQGIEPWAHLRGRGRPVNTYLNQLSRADYRELFGRRFEIVDEEARHPGLGRDRLTPEVRAELTAYPDDELFSNQVMFVLRPRS